MSFLLSLFEILNKGGWVAWCLAILSFVMWFALGCRHLILKRERLTQFFQILNRVKEENLNDLQLKIESLRHEFLASLEGHKQTLRSIVVVAPLLGLLGTVIGMIETFESLQDSALFSQSGGIAGGISQALITTQMGLVVAIPGLLLGRRFDKIQENYESEVDQYIGRLNLEGGKL